MIDTLERTETRRMDTAIPKGDPARAAEFAKRLDTACDAHPHAPPLHRGRYRWICDEMEKHGILVTTSAVAKWFSGDYMPRGRNMDMLARILDVDVVWLQTGVDAMLRPKEQRNRNALAEGAVNLVAGLIQLEGGHIAFPAKDDRRAKDARIDLEAIIRGARYSFHIILAERGDGDKMRIGVPLNYHELVVLAVVIEGFAAVVYEVTPDVIERGKNRGGSIEVETRPGELREITSFAERL